MSKYIVLFRGINVGGNNIVPMKTLVPLLEAALFEEVSYYIQSGNIVLKSKSEPTDAIKSLVNENFGFTPELFLLHENDFNHIVSNNPYKTFEGKFVHYYFCHQPIALNQEKINHYINETESYSVKGNIFYLHAPNGIGRSKLVANIERCLDQQSTGRNLNTINKISALVTST